MAYNCMGILIGHGLPIPHQCSLIIEQEAYLLVRSTNDNVLSFAKITDTARVEIEVSFFSNLIEKIAGIKGGRSYEMQLKTWRAFRSKPCTHIL